MRSLSNAMCSACRHIGERGRRRTKAVRGNKSHPPGQRWSENCPTQYRLIPRATRSGTYLHPAHGPALLCEAKYNKEDVYQSDSVPRCGGREDYNQQLVGRGTELPQEGEGGREAEDSGCQVDGNWDGNWDTQELKGMSDYEIVCMALRTVMVDPPGFVGKFRG